LILLYIFKNNNTVKNTDTLDFQVKICPNGYYFIGFFTFSA